MHTRVSSATRITPKRRDCFADSVAIRIHRSRLFLPSGNTTARSDAIGMNSAVPSSLSFSTIQSARSPFGTAAAIVHSKDFGRPATASPETFTRTSCPETMSSPVHIG